MLAKETLAVHSGTIIDEMHGGILSPLFSASSHKHLDMTEDVYPRHGNLPNQRAVAEKMCALESGGEAALVFSSGMAAFATAMLSHLKAGDHIVLQNGVYSGALKFVQNHFAKLGITYSVSESCEVESIIALVNSNTRMIYIETPTNPLLKILNIELLTRFAKSRGMFTIIDNTVATPINQNPLEYGVDLVLHSATKFLGGHGDVSGGVAVGSEESIAAMAEYMNDFGGCLNAQSCHLLERSLRTLAIRMNAINRNAMELASRLNEHPNVTNVFYPGLPSHHNHSVAREQMRGFGGMVSFEIAPRFDATSFQKKLNLIVPSNSLGDLETTLNSPYQASSSFRSLSEQEQKKSGITRQLIRMSVGIEDVNDLYEDLHQALK
ncbi:MULTISPECIES: trans-sulfuration enzyme family protein [Serratia]|uniref:trans-sulfuration enzyme family protein n=1 Tax=Serratia TaxID=613 RepID=UPI000EFB6B67|nr:MULTISPECIES: PLP-dependent aspartate aminotransferase family protein [Serratia]MBH1927852.1 PLP-dependent transferase [Serratia ureilytica]MBH2542190.1 PLP-dependent transferase [Serratia ureilytica]MBH2556232.1 PLP-dependent transferase [Serratia ureilytica]MBH2650870.1 PLP-dependent transferase [Serratia ureilytica]MBN5270292.1 PLP-dependent transferase [Serratia ureilytica]